MEQQQLIRKIQDKRAVVAIIGMGYVGLPLMRHAKLIVDTRGFYLDAAENVVKA